MTIRDIDLTQAAYIYGLANTPLFLVRKLQEDPSVRAIGDSLSGAQIVEELRRIINAEPMDAVEAVRPYAYLTALWFMPEIDHLREAVTFQTPIYRWYSYIAGALLASFSPVQGRLIHVPGMLPAPAVSQGSTTSTRTDQIIIVS